MRASIHALAAVLLLACEVLSSPPHCLVPEARRKKCGWLGIDQTSCISQGCCFEPKVRGFTYVPRCYYGVEVDNYLSHGHISGHKPVKSTAETKTVATYYNGRPKNPNKLSLLALVQMKRDNVSQIVINSLLADAIPGGEFFFALQDGELDRQEIAKLMKGYHGAEWNEWISFYLSGKDVHDLLYGQLSSVYGIDPTVVKLLMTNNRDPVLKHLVATLSSQGHLNPLSKFVLHSIASGEGITTTGMTDFVVEQIFQHENRFTVEAYKALLRGNKMQALQYAFLASRSRAVPLKKHYPHNEALFAYFVDNQVKHPGKITPSMILSLALNHTIKALNTGKSFIELFGIKAFDYVCEAHTSNIRLSCSALKHDPYHSSLDCINAGCCLRETEVPGGRPQCYENVLGHIGVAIAQNVWDEDEIVATMFGGVLPTLEQFYPDGVPWIPSSELPSKFTSYLRRDPNQPDWFTSLTQGGINLHPHPTLMPNTRPSKFRPNFVWKPHGATPFPYPTELPGGANHIATDAPMSVDGVHVDAGGASPVVQGINTQVFASCRGVKPEDRYECIPNSEALADGGGALCTLVKDCCYDPIWRNLSVPACFRKASYGQCYDVEPEERLDCGKPGITKDECLANPRCCYDSSIDADKHRNPVPWCFFKKQSFVTDKEKCTRVGHGDRVGCFPYALGEYYNEAVSQEVCEHKGCCYEKVHVSYFSRTVLGAVQPPACYKKLEVVVEPTSTTTLAPAPPPGSVPPPTCKGRHELDPYSRVDCGNFNYFECVVVNECCYDPEFILPGAPWCFQRS